jgi:putative Mg2+ transporter-C (MgtC) family protein
VLVFANLLGALLLGLVVGYERSYHGRAAGMRTYGLVCMASCALTVISGYPQFWYGGSHAIISQDPTRTIQGIVTGIGFLGAGVIMKEGFNISGLTTAASLWASSAIGVLVGIGFYAAAILLAVLSAMLMMWGARIEARLPTRPGIAVTLRFKPDVVPDMDKMRSSAHSRGYEIAMGTLNISYHAGQSEWRFVAIALNKSVGAPLAELAKDFISFEGVENFQLAHARN